MTVHDVCRLTNASDYQVWTMLEKYIEQARNLNDYSEVKAIGIDETSIAKGHNYISLFVDLKEQKTIFAAKDKDSATVKAFSGNLAKDRARNNFRVLYVFMLYFDLKISQHSEIISDAILSIMGMLIILLM